VAATWGCKQGKCAASCYSIRYLFFTSCLPPCLPHVYLMFTSCLPHVYLMFTHVCLPHVYLMFTSCLPDAYLMFT